MLYRPDLFNEKLRRKITSYLHLLLSSLLSSLGQSLIFTHRHDFNRKFHKISIKFTPARTHSPSYCTSMVRSGSSNAASAQDKQTEDVMEAQGAHWKACTTVVSFVSLPSDGMRSATRKNPMAPNRPPHMRFFCKVYCTARK